MAKDPERVAKRAAEAAKLGITEDELRAQRKAADDEALAAKAAELGVSVERYLDERKRRRNRFNRRTK
ncbi:MAG: hypothetical protein M3Z03_13195 [Actinomycetota bacterium]|nr:hypothetical protein [Actinomycetota bacterium]